MDDTAYDTERHNEPLVRKATGGQAPRKTQPSIAIGVQAFAKRVLTHEEWITHLEGALMPALEQTDLGINISYMPRYRSFDKPDNDAPSQSRCIEVVLPTKTEQSLTTCSTATKSAILQTLQNETGVEYVIQPTALLGHHKHPGLAVFDMDSTLIQQEVIDELARAVGLYDQVAAITEAAMRGEAPYTDFEASLRARVALLKGVPTTIWDQLKASTITFTLGANVLVKALKGLGWKTAVLSGGFTPLANWVKDTLGLDYAYANHLVANEVEGILTGELVPDKPIIHAEKKRELLLEIAAREGIPPERVIAVGDGSNDLKMMSVAGLGIAFNAKPKVQALAPTRLNSGTLLDVMHILGYTDIQIEMALAGKRDEIGVLYQ